MKRSSSIVAPVAAIVIAVIVLVCPALCFMPTDRASAAEATAAGADSDEFFYGGDAYDITDVADALEDTDSGFEPGAEIVFVIEGDNPVTCVIPKAKFTNECAELVIGDEWGYYIKTERESAYHQTNNFRSYVTLFDIEYTYDESAMVASNEVTVLSQNLYVTVPAGSGMLHLPEPEDGYADDMRYIAFRNETDGYAVAYFESMPRYYLRDVSFAASLYNENSKNFGDDGYYAESDIGSYFVGMTYGYDGTAWEDGTLSVWDDAVMPAAELIIDKLLGQIAIPDPFDTMVELLKFSGSAAEIAYNAAAAAEGQLTFASQKILYEAFAANRDDQIEEYGNMIKAAAMTINSAADGRQLWFGENGNAEARFQIGHSALGSEPTEYTRIVNELALSVAEVNGETAACGKNTVRGNIHSPVYTLMTLNTESAAYVLPEGVDYFEYTPCYNGEYEFAISGSESAAVTVYGEAGTTVTPTDGGTYMLTAAETYRIETDAAGAHAEYTITPSITVSDNVTLPAGGSRIISLGEIYSAVRTLSVGNDDIYIAGILRGAGGEPDMLETYGEDFTEITYAFDSSTDGIYYALLCNLSETSQTADISFEDIEEVYVGADGAAETTVEFDGEHYSYICFTDLPAGNYVLTVEGAGGLSFDLKGFDFEHIPAGLFGVDTLTFDIDYQGVIYVSLFMPIGGNFECILNLIDNAYQWEIDGVRTYDPVLYAEQGETLDLYYVVNGIVQTEYTLQTRDVLDQYNYVKITNNKITILNNSYVNGNGFTVTAYQFDDLNAPCPLPLTIIPTLKYPFQGIKDITIDDQNDVTISWENVNNLEAFDMRIVGTNVTYTIDVASYPDREYTITASQFAANSPIQTIEVTRIVYDYAKVGPTEAEMSAPMEYAFDYYFGGGTGTSGDPYLIEEKRHFLNINEMPQTGSEFSVYYKLMTDLDLSYFMGISAFYGTFDGNQHTISWGWRYSGDDNIEPIHALFLKNYGRIKMLNVEVEFSANWFGETTVSYLGGIVGRNHGYIVDSYCKTTIDSRIYKQIIGGIAACNESNGNIYYCDSTGDITGAYVIGGIAGINDNQINGCYVLCNMTLDYFDLTQTSSYAAMGQIAGVNNDYIYGCDVGTDNSGYRMFFDLPTYIFPYAGFIVGAQSSSARDLRECMNMGLQIDDSDLTIFQKMYVGRVSNGYIGREYDDISWR